MANSGERSFAQELNTWIQTIGIIIAACWGVYTFVYKEIMVPKSAPVNITLNLELKKIGTGLLKNKDRIRPLVPVELKVSAKNPSSREVYLLTGAWIAYGMKIDHFEEVQSFSVKDIVSEQNKLWYKERHSGVLKSTVVAFGGVFRDTSLKPDETTVRTLMFYLPPDEYDVLEVHLVMPTVGRKDAVEVEWKVDETGALAPTMFRLAAEGERKKMERDRDGGYSDENLEMQMAHSSSVLSLWQ